MDSLRGTREAGKDHLDSLGGTREAGKDHLDSLRGTREAGKDTREAPGRQERTFWTAWEAPGRHQGLLKAILCYEDALNGPGAKFKEENRFGKRFLPSNGLGFKNVV